MELKFNGYYVVVFLYTISFFRTKMEVGYRKEFLPINTLLAFVFFIAFIVAIVFVIMALFQRFKKNSEKSKKQLKLAAISFVVSIGAFLVYSPSNESEVASNNGSNESSVSTLASKPVEKEAAVKEETEEEKAARELKEAEEKAAAEQKAKEEAEAKAKAEAEQKAKEEAERLARLEALKLSGNGDSVTNTFTLEDGFLIMNAKHSGSRNFVLTLYNGAGERIELLVNTIGNYTGAQIISIEAGEYRYEVVADGAWNIEMSQEIPEVLPQGAASGYGDSVVFMEIAKGSYKLTASNDGDSNFVIKANDSTLLFNEIGNYSGSIIQNVNDSSIYYFNIISEGNWSFSFE